MALKLLRTFYAFIYVGSLANFLWILLICCPVAYLLTALIESIVKLVLPGHPTLSWVLPILGSGGLLIFGSCIAYLDHIGWLNFRR